MSILSYLKFELLKSSYKKNLIFSLLVIFLVNLALFARFKSNASLLYQYLDKPDCDFSTYCLYQLSAIHKNVMLLMIIIYFLEIFLAEKLNSQNTQLLPIRKSVAYIGDLIITILFLSIFLFVLCIGINWEFDFLIPSEYWKSSPISKMIYFKQIAIDSIWLLPTISFIGTTINKFNKIVIALIVCFVIIFLLKTHMSIGDINVQLLKNKCF